MANIVFHESYGEVTRAQLAAYRKHNVSPSDHDDLVRVLGEDNRDAIIKAVKTYVYPPGSNQFSIFEFWNRRPL